ncbi:hypothetical protein JCM10908_000861 [Rhodotorula pacifica]|uniref:uncharacterized protein n=1 Tax=Rhodotorula pacifica TaxID=1495444 RepID=UPI0031817322
MASRPHSHLIRSKAMPGFSAYLLLDTQPAHAYTQWNLDRKEGAAFVVSEGMTFELGLVDERVAEEIEGEGYEAALFLDGIQKTNQLISKEDPWFQAPKDDPRRRIRFTGIPQGEFLESWGFGPTPIITPDEDADGTGISDLASHRATGTAQIRIYRLSHIESIAGTWQQEMEPRRYVKHRGGLNQAGEPVPANGIKCLSSLVAVSAGRRYLRDPPQWRKAMRLDETDEPYFTFEFRYGTQDEIYKSGSFGGGASSVSAVNSSASQQSSLTASSLKAHNKSLAAATTTATQTNGGYRSGTRTTTSTTEIASSTGGTNVINLSEEDDTEEEEEDEEEGGAGGGGGAGAMDLELNGMDLGGGLF